MFDKSYLTCLLDADDVWIAQAYMQGQNDPEYEAIIKAISAITFLATPHRGTNLAQTLNRVLQSTMVNNPKQYITDLAKNSLTLQKLNEQFRHIAPKLDIVSFYETHPTSIGLKQARIVGLPPGGVYPLPRGEADAADLAFRWCSRRIPQSSDTQVRLPKHWTPTTMACANTIAPRIPTTLLSEMSSSPSSAR